MSTILDKLYEIKVREVKDSEGKVKSELLSADTVGQTYHAEMAYENPDGSKTVCLIPKG